MTARTPAAAQRTGPYAAPFGQETGNHQACEQTEVGGCSKSGQRRIFRPHHIASRPTNRIAGFRVVAHGWMRSYRERLAGVMGSALSRT